MMAAGATARSTAAKRRPATRARAAGRTASRSAARSAPKRAAAAQPRRRQSTPATGFVPVAAARTAGAVGGLADSGLVLRLTRSRLWIGLLGMLLVGIVALNVVALSFSSSSSAVARQSDELNRQNSALRAQIATQLSSEQVQAAATRLGLSLVSPGSIRYVRHSDDDAVTAAKRLRAGELTSTDVAAVPVAPVVPEETVVAEVPVEPAPTTDPAVPAPVEEAPVEAPAPEVAPETAAPVAGGGLTSP